MAEERFIIVDGSKWAIDPKSPDGLRWEPTFWEMATVTMMVIGFAVFFVFVFVAAVLVPFP